MEPLKHNCGVAMIRLRKPLTYYKEKYGTWMYGLNKLYLLMEKQHNRGQDGAGLSVVKLQAPAGEEYLYRERVLGSSAIQEIFASIHGRVSEFAPKQFNDADYAARHIPFAGECMMGHLRYSTTGRAGLSFIHPMVRRSNWSAKTLSLCGNFNLTNVDGIFDEITSVGQHPRATSDTNILLEQVGHRLDREVERLYRIATEELNLEAMAITQYIEANINMANVLRRTSPIWDGGFVMCGNTGSGSSFALRDRNGIRTAFYYIDDEVIVLASERPVIQTTFNVPMDSIKELQPGEALLIDQDASVHTEQILEPAQFKACSFERIYFSRGSDADIYKERKQLGALMTDNILKLVDHDIAHTVFSFIPNTAEVAYFGMIEGLNAYLNKQKAIEIAELGSDIVNRPDTLQQILKQTVRTEKVALKDIKLRTFIAEGATRNDLAAHVYDVTYGALERKVDNLVVIDDSIVRGTTLRKSILKILSRLRPKKIIVVSSCPQIRYPDYYGIDMSVMKDFIAFRAAIALLEKRNLTHIIDQAYQEALKLRITDKNVPVPNVAKAIYEPFTAEELSEQMAAMLKPDEVEAEVHLLFQTMEGLHEAIPNHPGDWYFSGDFPTAGGSHLVNESFIQFVEEDWLPNNR